MYRYLLYVSLVFAGLLSISILAINFGPLSKSAVLPLARHCFHQLYSSDHSKAKILLIGSSRVWLGVDPDLLAQQLGLGHGEVVNLAHAHRDYDYDQYIVDSTTAKNSVKLVIFATIPPPESKGYNFSDFVIGSRKMGRYYANGAPVNRVFNEISKSNRSRLVKWHDKIRLIRYRLKRSVPLFLRGDYYKSWAKAEPGDIASESYCWRREWNKEDRFFDINDKENKGGVASSTIRIENKGNSDIERYRMAYDNISNMLTEKKIAGAFLFVPTIRSVLPESSYITKVENLTGQPYLIPPETLINELKGSAYADPNHLNLEGRRQFTLWLADEIRNRTIWGID